MWLTALVVAGLASQEVGAQSITATVPIPQPSVLDAPWAGNPVAPTAGLANLAVWWQDWIVPGSGCPLLAPIAQPVDFGATGPADTPRIGSAGGGPWISWPGATPPSIQVHEPPLSIDELSAYYGPSATVITYTDGSEERLIGDGRSLVLLPGVPCAYEIDGAMSAMVEIGNFRAALRLIATAEPATADETGATPLIVETQPPVEPPAAADGYSPGSGSFVEPADAPFGAINSFEIGIWAITDGFTEICEMRIAVLDVATPEQRDLVSSVPNGFSTSMIDAFLILVAEGDDYRMTAEARQTFVDLLAQRCQ